MDNVAHTLCGLALARAGLDRRGPLVTPVLAIGANLPDLDHAWSLGGVRYLVFHRGITHSFAGIVVESLALALAAFGLGSLADLEGNRFRPLLVAAFLGLLSHLALDGLNSYGIRPWLPFSAARHCGDLAFIVDPWLWLLFGAASFLGLPHRQGSGRVWPALAGLSLAFSFLGIERKGPELAAVPGAYLLGLVLVLVVHLATDRGEHRRRGLARFALGLVLVYLGALAGISAAVLEKGRATVERRLAPGDAIVNASVSPGPGIPWRATAILETAREVHLVRVDVLGGTVEPTLRLEKHLDDPALEDLRGSPACEAWRYFARHPFAARTTRGSIVLGDARYDTVARESWCNSEVPLPRGR